jgi:hypothetical protein
LLKLQHDVKDRRQCPAAVTLLAKLPLDVTGLEVSDLQQGHGFGVPSRGSSAPPAVAGG